MNTFQLHLMSPKKEEWVPGLVSFTGRDPSGSFNILAHAARRVTALVFGLAQFRTADEKTGYLALPGGLLYFIRNELRLATTNYARDPNYETITALLEKEVRMEEAEILETKKSIHRLDEEILKRMLRMKWRGDL